MMSRIDSWHWKISTSRHFQNGRQYIAQIQHCPISTTFDMWVEYATGRKFSMSGINSGHHYLPTNQIWMTSDNVEFLPPIFIMMSRIDSWHWKFSTGRHFQNGHHNTAKIQHCPISSKFDMWVDNDVPNWFLTLKNFYQSPFSKWPPIYRTNSTFWKWRPVENFQCQELIRDIIIYPQIKFGWHRTMLNFYHPFFMLCFGSHFENGRHLDIIIYPHIKFWWYRVEYDVPNWFLRSKNFCRSPFSKSPPQYRTNSALFDFNDISYVGRLWCPILCLYHYSFRSYQH
jgi:hypothetical protein